MATYTSTVDLIQRRLSMNFERDNVGKCYLKMVEGNAKITIILDEDCSRYDVTKVAVRFQHLISDKLDCNAIKVLPKTNYFIKDIDTFEVWNKQEGFTGL